MKLSIYVFIVQLVALNFIVAGESNGQHSRSVRETFISLNLSNASIKEAFKHLESISDFRFNYDKADINTKLRIDLTYSNTSVAEILLNISKEYKLGFKQLNNTIQVDKLEHISPDTAIEVVFSDVDISGKITDENGDGLPGASVVVKGTTTGTTTDLDGNYKISVAEQSVLTISFVGYKTQEVTIGSQSVIDVQMVVDAEQLEEIVVVGYGTARKKDLTGAVGRVNVKEKATMINVSPVQMLRGSVAGVNVTDNGRLGSDGSISIRGQNSISANNSPMIILDGVPYSGALTDINSNDIESIDVLKDASAAAIYGSRAANGVILITTKRGDSEKPLILYNANYGGSYFGHIPEYSNAEQYIQKVLDGRAADGKSADPNDLANYLNPLEVDNFNNGKTINPWKEISQDAPMMNHEISFSGNSNNVKYYFSGSYTNQKGVLLNDQFKRYSFRGNIETYVTDWLKVGTNTSYSNRDYSGNEASFGEASYLSPYASLYRNNSKSDIYFLPMNEGFIHNPLTNPFYSDNLDTRQNFFTNVFANIELPFGISYQLNYANTLKWSNVFDYNKSYSASDEGVFRLGSGAKTHGNERNWILQNIIKWNKTINEDHTIDLTILYSREHSDSNSSRLSSNNIWNDGLSYNGLHIGENASIVTQAGEDNTLSSMFRLNYRYKDKYLFTMTARRDGYSTFGNGQKYGTFPSIAVGWNISEENFLKGTTWVNYLKLRYSYGKNGNQAIGRYASLSKLGTINYVFGDVSVPSIGLYTSSMANADLGWETTLASNFGLDFSLLGNRISGALEYYIVNTEDILLQRTIPIVNGFSSVWQNIGATRNN
ncbi:SusC/RagA family TonB-linked outer membrane protein [Reichenbachiella sp. MALMAid0571]